VATDPISLAAQSSNIGISMSAHLETDNATTMLVNPIGEKELANVVKAF
jgi:hypothetical protein